MFILFILCVLLWYSFQLLPSQSPVNGVRPASPANTELPPKCKPNKEPPPRPPQPTTLPKLNMKRVKSSSTPSSPCVKPDGKVSPFEVIEIPQPMYSDTLCSVDGDHMLSPQSSSHSDDNSNIISNKFTASKPPSTVISIKHKERLMKKTRSADLFQVPKGLESCVQEQLKHKLRKTASNPNLKDSDHDRQTSIKLSSDEPDETEVEPDDNVTSKSDVRRRSSLSPEDAIPCDQLNEMSKDFDGGQSKGLLRRMSTTIKSLRRGSKNIDTMEERKNVKDFASGWRKNSKVEMLDLRQDNKKRNSGIVDFLYGNKLGNCRWLVIQCSPN